MKKIYVLTLLVFFIFVGNKCLAQPPYTKPILQAYAGKDSAFCLSACTNISRFATLDTNGNKVRQTTSYTSAPMSMPAVPYLTHGAGTNTIIVGQDDVWSAVIPLQQAGDPPFNFSFFGNTYNSVVIGANGIISFNTAYAGTTCPWSYTTPPVLPDPAKPLNSIYGVYTDIDPSVGGNINWYREGTYPNRRFIINYYQVPLFSLACNNLLVTTQIVLHEAFSIVDVIVRDLPSCCTWNGGQALTGMQNANGTLGYGTVSTCTHITNTAIRFTPSGVPTQILYSWKDLSTGTVVSTTNPLVFNICPGVTKTFEASLTDTLFGSVPYTFSDTVTFTANTGPAANAGPDKAIGCTPSVTIGTPAVAGNTYSWTPVAGLSNATVAQPTTSTPNTYYLTVTNTSTGCTGKDTVIVTNGAVPPTANAGPDQTLTCSALTIGTAAVAGNTYSWTPVAGLSNANIAQPTVNAPNTYTLTVTNTASGCTASDQVVISGSIIIPSANAGPDKTITCSAPTTNIGTPAVGGNTYLWTPAAGLSNANIAQPVASAANTYIVKVTSSSGCSVYDTVIVTQNATPPLADAGPDQTVTCTTPIVPIGTAAVGGNTYSWTPAIGLSNPSIAQPSTGTPNTYTLTVTNTATGCTASDQVVISQNKTAPTANAGPDQTITCTTPNVTLGTASVAGNTYVWTPAGGLSNTAIAQPLATSASTYTLTVTNTANGCTASDQVVVSQNTTAPAANVGADQTLTCTTASVTIGTAGVAGNTYAWLPAGGLSNASIAQPTASAANTYTLTVTNTANGCTASDQVIVSQNTTVPIANAGADQTITCSTPSVTIGTAGVAGNTYSWTPAAGLSNAAIAQPTASAPNTYTLTVTNTANGCTATDQVIISQNKTAPSGNAGVDQTITCTTPSLTIGTAGVAGNTYAWTPAAGLSNAAIAQPTASAANTYTLTVTNTANGCTASDQVVISQNTTAPTANAGADQTLTCTTASVPVGTAGVGGNTYAWTPAAGLSNVAIAQPTASAPNTYTLTVTNTTNGCTASDQVVISQNITAPTANAGADQTLTCTTTSVTIGTAGVGGNTYSWTPAVGLSNASIAQPSTSTPNTYTLTVTNTANGCTASDQVVISQNITAPTANAGADQTITCTTPTVIIGTASVAGNTYSWTPAAGLSNAAIAQPTVSAANTYTLTVTNSVNGCTASDQVVISQNKTAPVANAGPDQTLTCTTTSIQIGTASVAGNTYSWTPAAGLSNASIAQPTASAPNTYTLTVTNNTNGCTASDAVTILQNITAPAANAGADQTLTCTKTSVTIGTASVGGNTYVWTPAAGLSNASIAQPTTSAANTYTLTVTNNANGCTASDQVVISQNITVPTANAGADQTITCSTPNVMIGTTGVGGNTYAWTPAAGLSNASIAQPTTSTANTYTLTVTNTANGCTASDQVIISQNTTAPTANAGVDQTLTCTTTTVTIGTAGAGGNTYSWNPAGGLNNASIAQPTANAPNTYTLTVTNNANGCTATDAVTILQNTTAPTANAGVDRTLTCTIPSVILGSAGAGGNTYAWTPAAGLSDPAIAQPSTSTPNTYTLIVTNIVNGCTASDQVIVSQNTTVPIADAGPDQTLSCSSSGVTLGSPFIAGNTYSWSPAANVSNPNLAQPTTNTAGTYTLTVTNSTNGCSATDQVVISQNVNAPAANAGIDRTLTCTQTSFTLGTAGTAGDTYAWTPTGGLNDSTIAQPIVTTQGTYTLTVTNTANGCTSTDQVTISKDVTPPSANAGADQTLTCTTTTVTLGATGNAGNTYSWNPSGGLSSASSPQPTTSTPNTYTLTVTNNTNGCTASDAVTILQNITAPTANAGADQILTCTHPTLTLGTAGVAGNTYAWSPAANVSNAAAAQPTTNTIGTYTLTVTNNTNGCTSTDAAMITVDTLRPTANAGADQTLTCINTSVTLGTAGAAGNSYSWSPAAGLSDPNIAQPTTGTPGTFTLTVTRNANGCTSSDQVIISKNTTAPTVDAGPDQILTCSVTSVTIGTAGIAGQTYTWSPTIGLNNSTIPQPTASKANIYTVTATNTTNGCIATDQVKVLQDTTTPVANAGADQALTCATTSVTIGTAAIAGNTYSWSPINGLSDPSIAQPTTDSAYVYTVTVTNATNGCKNSDVVAVRENITVAQAVAGTNQTLTCADTAIKVGAPSQAGYSYSWIPVFGLDNANIAQPNVSIPGTYTLTITNNANGCTSVDAVTIDQNTIAPKADAGLDKSITCVVKSVVIGGSPTAGNTYSWSPSTGLNNANIAQPTSTTPQGYELTVKNTTNGCSSTDSMYVLIDTITPIANAGDSGIFPCPYAAVELGTPAEPNRSYHWTPAIGLHQTDIAQPLTDSAGTFVLYVINTINGCQSAPSSVIWRAKNCDCEFFVPSAFSPNSDGINDKLFANRYCDDFTDFTFSVYNRWGELVFRTNDLNQGWDGFYKDESQNMDSYVWTVEYFDVLHNQKKFEKGVVTLLK